MEEDDDAIPLPRPRTPHIKKRALKNKALTVTFNEKDLSYYVTGFQKRKKKRRREAEQQHAEALRLKRIEMRKKRKLEKEAVYGGGALNDLDESELVEDDEDQPTESISGTKTYDSGDIQVTVTTSEISREEEDLIASQKRQPAVPVAVNESTKKLKVTVNNKKPFKRVLKPKSSKSRNKKDKSKSVKRNRSSQYDKEHFAPYCPSQSMQDMIKLPTSSYYKRVFILMSPLLLLNLQLHLI